MKQAIIYSRFSPRPQKKPGECLSCEFQEERCRAYCDLHQLYVLAVYHDKALSGKKVDNRPGLSQALTHVCAEQGILITYNLARLSRSLKDLIRIVDVLEKKHADLACVVENIDTHTPTGRAFFHIMGAFAQWQRETTGEHTREVLLDMQKNMRRISRRPPYGYQFNPQQPRHLIEHHQEQIIIKIISKCYFDKKMRPCEILAFLIQQGHKPRKGSKQWYQTTLTKILDRLKDSHIDL